MMRRPLVCSITAALLLLTLGTACGGGDEGAEPSATPSPSAPSATPTPTPSPTRSPTPAPTPSATPTPAPLPPGFSTARVTGVSQGLGLLTAVRVGAQPGFDRVVFEFESAVPGYSVGYTPLPLVADPSGLPVAIQGDHAIWVRMEPSASYDPSSDPLRLTYAGPTRITTSLQAVLEVVKTGDFEAVLSWAIGVRGERPFKVSTLSGPPRLVVDVATG